MSLIDDVKEMEDLIDKSKHLELYGKLLDLRSHVSDLTEENRNLKQENQELKRLLRVKEQMVFEEPLYWMAGDEVPFCPNCWESKEQAIHLLRDKTSSEGRYTCMQCNRAFKLNPNLKFKCKLK